MAAVFAGMLLGYGYHFLMVRLLPTVTYGDLSLIIGILSILLIPTSSLQVAMTREIAKLDNEATIHVFLQEYAKRIAFFGSVLGIIFFLSSYLIVHIFNDANILHPLQIVSLSIPFAYLLSVIKAYFQGTEKIGLLCAMAVSDPAIKLVSAALLVYAGLGLSGAAASLTIAPFIFVLPGILLWKRKPCHIIAHKLKSNKSLVYILATNTLLMVFLYIDLFFVKYYMGSEEAGFYNVANITAKAIMYAAGGITFAFLPKTSRLSIKSDSRQIKKLVFKAGLLLMPLFIIFLLFPQEIISLFYTEKYLSALLPFRILTVGMFAYALFTILLNLSWSQNNEKTPLIISFIMLISDAILLSYMIPAYGLVGAALATSLLSIALLAALSLCIKRDFNKLKGI